MARLNLLGVGVDNLTEGEALAHLDALIKTGRAHHVVTVNPEFLVLAQDNPWFKAVLDGAHLALADGVGLVWASYLMGCPLRARLPGVDVVRRLARLASQKGYRLFLLGAAQGVAESTAQVLAREYPGLIIAGTWAGSPAAEEEADIVQRIQEAKPQVLFVAYGAPQQDLWIRRNLPHLPGVLAMGVGGSFDYISGMVPRAPAWMRRWGLEWLYRLMKEPWRWRRMLRLPRFAWLVTVQALKQRLGRRP